MVIEVTEENFNEIVEQSECPVLVEFWAPWCGPCKNMAPVLDELASDFDGKAKICKVNIDECEDLAYNYDVRSIPFIILFNEGEIAGTKVGTQSKTSLTKLLNEVCNEEETEEE